MWGRHRVINLSHLSICVRQRWKTALIVRFPHKLRPKYAPFSSFTHNTDWMHAVGYDELYKYFYCIWEKNGMAHLYHMILISYHSVPTFFFFSTGSWFIQNISYILFIQLILTIATADFLKELSGSLSGLLLLAFHWPWKP